jgi:hypothetical protein
MNRCPPLVNPSGVSTAFRHNEDLVSGTEGANGHRSPTFRHSKDVRPPTPCPRRDTGPEAHRQQATSGIGAPRAARTRSARRLYVGRAIRAVPPTTSGTSINHAGCTSASRPANTAVAASSSPPSRRSLRRSPTARRARPAASSSGRQPRPHPGQDHSEGPDEGSTYDVVVPHGQASRTGIAVGTGTAQTSAALTRAGIVAAGRSRSWKGCLSSTMRR